jgi:hypothetical protein
MPPNKTIWLVIILVTIWGTIAFKIFKGLRGDEVPQRRIPSQKVAEATPSEENYPLALNYADPFLKGSAKPRVESGARKRPPQKIIAPLASQPYVLVDWSKVEYLGCMYNASRKSMIASMRIDGIDYVGKQGEVINEFLLEKIYSDSLLISLGSQKKYILKRP